MNTADQTVKAGCHASTYNHFPVVVLAPVQSDQLCSIGTDMTSATSLSLSIYNLLLYGGIKTPAGKPIFLRKTNYLSNYQIMELHNIKQLFLYLAK